MFYKVNVTVHLGPKYKMQLVDFYLEKVLDVLRHFKSINKLFLFIDNHFSEDFDSKMCDFLREELKFENEDLFTKYKVI